MITLQSVEFSNMFSYGENNVLDLSKEKVTQLNGMNGCLDGDSIIIAADGSAYTIEEIVKNKLPLEVLGVDENNRSIITKVVDWFEHPPRQVFKVQFDNGNLLFITDNHLLKTPEGWKPLKELNVNDYVVDADVREYVNTEPTNPTSLEELLSNPILSYDIATASKILDEEKEVNKNNNTFFLVDKKQGYVLLHLLRYRFGLDAWYVRLNSTMVVGVTRLLEFSSLVPPILKTETKKLQIRNVTSVYKAPVYDIQTTSGNFVAGDTLVHNSGKTSISLVLQELLFNKNVKGLKKSEILNRNTTAKEYSGKVNFTKGSDQYEVKVSRKGNTGKVSLYKNGEDITEHKVLDTYKKIQNIFEMDFDVFSQLTYQSSTDLLDFLKATDSNRKKFLINLFHLDKYLEIGEKVKKELSETEKKLSKLDGELSSVTRFLEENPAPEKLEEKPLPFLDETLETQIAEKKTELQQYLTLCNKIDKNNMLIKDRDNIKFDVSMVKPELDAEVVKKSEAIKEEVSSIKTTVKNLKSQLSKLDLAETCYACKQPLNNEQSKALAEDLEAQIKKHTEQNNLLVKEYKELEKVILQHQKDKRAFETNEKSKEKFEYLCQMIDPSIPTTYPDYSQLQQELKDLEQQYSTQKKEYNDVAKYNESVKIRNAKVGALMDQIKKFRARQTLLNDDIMKIQSEVQGLQILKKAFSSSGIVAYKLENVVKQLEETINSYLAQLSDGKFQVVFRLDKDKLNIVVVNNGEEVSINSLSGGQFSRVQTSVLLAVRKTLNSLGSSGINLLFLDEVTGVLDAAGRDNLIEVLREEEDLNVFLISHEYSHPLIPKIEIEYQNETSIISA